MRKFQNLNFEKPVVFKNAHDYNNKKIVLQLFKILRSSTRASALKIKNFIIEATYATFKTTGFLNFLKNANIQILSG
jgi:hypothetical protein